MPASNTQGLAPYSTTAAALLRSLQPTCVSAQCHTDMQCIHPPVVAPTYVCGTHRCVWHPPLRVAPTDVCGTQLCVWHPPLCVAPTYV